ncbi:hypothetical protein GCM10008938_42300 [Deinococcus roseus]|uniref:Uncharacterized protein n=2 Tax=Deinococcus roseus TaxID=392414 RepID=A0ABQ2DAL5_9DEIO|nr:hypothetical protein GCM10008938_42300 [Deinococcus roseus]
MHPGLILHFECECRDETVEGLAQALNHDLNELVQVLQGEAPITPLLAIKIQQHWEISAGLLVSIQRDHDALLATKHASC